MAGSVTVTETKPIYDAKRSISRVTFAWTSDAAGAVSGTLSDKLTGIIARVDTIPSGGGTAPTDNYDVTLLDDNAVDVLAGQGANRDTANTESFCPGVAFKDGVTTGTTHVPVHGTLELQVANAGNAKQGTLVLFLI